MDNKKLSVIVPVYNAEMYIEKCINSIIKQDYDNVEIIIVNDGSTDNTHEVCEAIAKTDNRIVYLTQDKMGAIAARRNGVENCSGDYICFVDADDFILEQAYSYAKDAMSKGIDLIHFSIARYFDESNCKIDRPKLKEGTYYREEIENIIFPRLIWNFDQKCSGFEPQLGVNIIRSELVKRQYKHLNESFWYGEDIAIVYPSILKAESMEIIDKCYYMHRQRIGECWPYVKNDNYFDGLSKLFNYLLVEFDEVLNLFDFRKQIDYFYMFAVQLKKVAYQDETFEKTALFPFNRVETGKRIVLYGAGNVGKQYYNQLVSINYCQSLLWVDRRADFIQDERVKSIGLIDSYDFDYIVVAIENKTICNEVFEQLIGNGVNEKKIVLI